MIARHAFHCIPRIVAFAAIASCDPRLPAGVPLRSAPFESSDAGAPVNLPPPPSVARPPLGTERALCFDLIRAGQADSADIPGGVAIVITPASENDLHSLRMRAHSISRAMSPPAPPRAEPCELFDIARLGVTVVASNGPGAAWIVMTSEDAGVVDEARVMARDFVAKTRAGEVE